MDCPKCQGANFGFAKRCDHCGAELSLPRGSTTDSAPIPVEDLSTDKPALVLKLADGRLIRALPMKFAPRPRASHDTSSVLLEPIRLAMTHLVDAGVAHDEAAKYLPILIRRSLSLPSAVES